MPQLMVVIASTRPGRAGLAVGRWFTERAERHGGFDVVVVDLAELGLPFLDEPNHPRLRLYTRDHTWRWSAMVDGADAFVLVTPEYNYGYPAALKNAIDFLHHEWAHKPVGFVSYGGVAAGTRSVQQLKQVVTALSMVPVNEAVAIPFFTQFIDGDGRVAANEVMENAAQAMLGALVRMEIATGSLRAPRADRVPAMSDHTETIADGDGIEASAPISAPADGAPADGVDASLPASASIDEDPPPDDSYLLGATGTQDEVLAELARAEAQLHDPGLEPDDASGAVV